VKILTSHLQVDFSENCTCMFQDEIQSTHWKQEILKQLLPYIVTVNFLLGLESFVFAGQWRGSQKYVITSSFLHNLILFDNLSNITSLTKRHQCFTIWQQVRRQSPPPPPPPPPPTPPPPHPSP
jgi:hypothetical protein